jgi:methionyl-tRNA formyltransferase
MVLDDIGMIAGDTTRTKIYLAELIMSNIFPNKFIVLNNKSKTKILGQVDIPRDNKHSLLDIFNCEKNIIYDNIIKFELREILDFIARPYIFINDIDVNSELVLDELSLSSESIFIYSGYGGKIVSADVLNRKKILHVHGGYLPKFKGSTTNYYSILSENLMGATSFFLSEQLDSGLILHREKFLPPHDKFKIDHVTDSIFRAKVLIKTLEKHLRDKSWEFIEVEGELADIYYVIHPVLKHLAIFKKIK